VTRLVLRRGTVVSVEPLTVEVDGAANPAVAYEPVEVGDDVVVNVQARELGLGSGGFDIVHVNLTRGLGCEGEPGAHVMKLNYTSLQHAVVPVDGAPGASVKPVAVIALHGQLAPVAWAFRRAGSRLLAYREPLAGDCRRGVRPRVGFVQTWGGALPGELSHVVALLRSRGLLCGHVSAGPCFGGEREAITTAGALAGAFSELGWDAAIVGPGPGIIGSGTPLGHGGMAALDNAHTALALGCPTVIVPRMSSGDPRERHRGLSHHTRTVLELMLRPVFVALPEGREEDLPGEHEARVGEADLDAYRASRLPASTMGRDAEQDELFFRAALAGGSVLAGLVQWND
jgi:Protein of unknown function (DUF3866)